MVDPLNVIFASDASIAPPFPTVPPSHPAEFISNRGPSAAIVDWLTERAPPPTHALFIQNDTLPSMMRCDSVITATAPPFDAAMFIVNKAVDAALNIIVLKSSISIAPPATG